MAIRMNPSQPADQSVLTHFSSPEARSSSSDPVKTYVTISTQKPKEEAASGTRTYSLVASNLDFQAISPAPVASHELRELANRVCRMNMCTYEEEASKIAKAEVRMPGAGSIRFGCFNLDDREAMEAAFPDSVGDPSFQALFEKKKTILLSDAFESKASLESQPRALPPIDDAKAFERAVDLIGAYRGYFSLESFLKVVDKARTAFDSCSFSTRYPELDSIKAFVIHDNAAPTMIEIPHVLAFFLIKGQIGFWFRDRYDGYFLPNRNYASLAEYFADKIDYSQLSADYFEEYTLEKAQDLLKRLNLPFNVKSEQMRMGERGVVRTPLFTQEDFQLLNNAARNFKK